MDAKEREARDHRYEEFVLDQVKKYGDMHAKCAKVYLMLIFACIGMGIVGLIMGKPFLACLTIAAWSLGFMAAKRFSEAAAESVMESAEEIRKAIDDPDFDIPDDYPEEILSLRQLVCPTLKNIRSQLAAYGIMAVCCWGATVILFCVASLESYALIYILVTFIMAGMATVLTILAVRVWKDIPVAKSYEEYLNAIANE